MGMMAGGVAMVVVEVFGEREGEGEVVDVEVWGRMACRRECAALRLGSWIPGPVGGLLGGEKNGERLVRLVEIWL